MAGVKYSFRIGAFTPAEIPMDKLAGYLAELANLFGVKDKVHFETLLMSSTLVQVRVENEAVARVQTRLILARTGGADDVRRAVECINERLASDQAIGQLEDETGAEIIRFPGVELEARRAAISQTDELEGEVVLVGGRRKEEISVHLSNVHQEGLVYLCHATREIAKEIAPHIFGPVLRVRGKARWQRNVYDRWDLKDFKIEGFDVLESKNIRQVVRDIRSVKTGLDEAEDPIGELDKLRHGESDIA